MRGVRNRYNLFPSSKITHQNINRALPLRNCSNNRPAKSRNSVYILTEKKLVNDCAPLLIVWPKKMSYTPFLPNDIISLFHQTTYYTIHIRVYNAILINCLIKNQLSNICGSNYMTTLEIEMSIKCQIPRFLF